MNQFLYKQETYDIIGICMEVHNNLGKGFSEIVYKDAMVLEAIGQSISFEKEKELTINYKGQILKHSFYADFLFFENIIVEVKAIDKEISAEHISQTLNYLKVCNCTVGLIINFGRKSLEYKRLIF
jgi:GxxExxY protein